MHREILGLPAFPGDERTGDHEDHDTLNNQYYNLRRANKTQQGVNKRRQNTSTTGFKGVSKDRNKYRARIHINGQIKSLGTRSTPEAAHALYWNSTRSFW